MTGFSSKISFSEHSVSFKNVGNKTMVGSCFMTPFQKINVIIESLHIFTCIGEIYLH